MKPPPISPTIKIKLADGREYQLRKIDRGTGVPLTPAQRRVAQRRVIDVREDAKRILGQDQPESD